MGYARDHIRSQHCSCRYRYVYQFAICLFASPSFRSTSVLTFVHRSGPFYFSSVSPHLIDFYKVGSFQINVFGLITMIVGVPATLAAMIVQEKKGLRLSSITAAILVSIGSLLPFLANYVPDTTTSYAVTVFGQVILSAGTPFSLNSSTKLAAEWFGEKERAIANTLAQLGNPIGLAIIFLLAPAIVGDSTDGVRTLHLVVFAMCISLALPALLIRDRPPTPPSLSNKPKESVLGGLKSCLSNTQFLILILVYSTIIACFSVLQTFLADLLVPYGLGEDESGTVGAIFIGCGIVAAVVNGLLMDRIQKHKAALKVLSLVAVAGIAMIMVGASQGSKGLVYAGAAVYGVGGFPTMPLMMELGAECTYPVGEATSTNILQLGQAIMSIILIPSISALRSPVDGTLLNGMIFLTSLHFAAHLLTWFYTAEPRRSNADAVAGTGPDLPKETGSVNSRMHLRMETDTTYTNDHSSPTYA
ncbi:MFS general substrate transporter [Gonapodya prolifera JEL478]|uniref:MFS general substrate transporter n=1 Tax=Gonapodya prolifera (strain JEL478) TaxID=1344416 RepID=A0A139A510_GONPJ|nr:MFS general substrate transporter [Gonapodya prolifera JEL478]|eukprot:KXS11585.1 MFS general substrate transporter [Gonapodya prolifera JEL478]